MSWPPHAASLTLPVAAKLPNACASCMGPYEQTIATYLKVGSYARTYNVPSCRACASRSASSSSRRTFATVVVLTAAVVLGWLQYPYRNHLTVLAPGTIVAALLIGFAMRAFGRGRAPVAPATSIGPAVRLTAWNETHAWFHCSNPTWAALAARGNGGQITVAPRQRRGGAGFVALSLFAASLAAFVGAVGARPSVYLRNSTDKPLAFYIDGERQEIVEPGKHTETSLTYGLHRIGWSEVNESAARTTIDADLERSKEHLVNPDEAGCFWREAAVYGHDKIAPDVVGPLPLQTFYTLDRADLWFEPLPPLLTSKKTGETRVAIQSYRRCTEAMKVCDKAKVKTALLCDAKAKDDASAAVCWAACEVEPPGTTKLTSAMIEPPSPSPSPMSASSKRKKKATH